MRVRSAHLMCLLVVLGGCAHSPRPETRPDLTLEQVMPLFPSKVQDADGWARDLIEALSLNRLPVDLEHVCSVIAVADQESGVQANPGVPNLPVIARKALSEKAESLGPFGEMVLQKLLEGKAPGSSKTFDQRIATLRTEADLDLLFRDILADHHRRSPLLYAAANAGATLFSSGGLEERNPVTTAGSMQVSVRFAETHAETLHRDTARVRDELYTRSGGLLYGSARLWSFEARYDDMKFRFADYNAGAFTSRNAAFQEQLAALTRTQLALDGDLLSYQPDGDVKSDDTKSMAALRQFREALAPTLSERRVARDARDEKSADFEKTETWSALKRTYEAIRKKEPEYARLPEVTLTGPKLRKPLSTAWFAQSAGKRYQACLERAR